MLGKFLWLFLVAFLTPLALHGAWWLSREQPQSWATADWSSAGLLPEPAAAREAVVYVFSAPTGRWKGVFAVHSWIVVKEHNARRYTRYDVAGWGRPLKVDGWAPDARWYGNAPRLVAQIKGPDAQAVIPRVRAAVSRYPHGAPGGYRVWPGPNSNTFVAEVLSQVPELGIALPANAIGKDYRGDGVYVGLSPSRTGVQMSLLGLLGVTVSWIEGIELNILGLVAGLDVRQIGIKLPGWGTVSLLGSRGVT